jgi:serine/threonine protein kinase
MASKRGEEIQVGTRLLDRYVILDRAGSGGMALIYRAEDERLDRVVCVKLLRTTLVEGSGSTSGRAVYEATYSHFLKEARALSRLQHPNTLRIYDFGYYEAGGNRQPFQVSEFLDGGNLETHVRAHGPYAPADMLQILESVADALAEAHSVGILHRDIKPSNILFVKVRDELVPKLADFGIAHTDLRRTTQGADAAEASLSTVALFSPRWAAPEQLCGAREGPYTDVYALALLAAFMLRGRPLFDDDDVRSTFNERVRSDDLVRERLTRDGLSGAPLDAFMRGLDSREEQRTASVTELAEALRAAFRVRRRVSSVPEASATRDEPQRSAGPSPDSAPASQPKTDAPSPDSAPASPRELPREDAGAPNAPELPRPAATPSISLDGGGQPIHERVTQYGARPLRFVQVHERLDLAFRDAHAGDVRFRVTMLPGGQSLNIKGLSCFVAKRGQRPNPAITVKSDGSADFVSARGERLGEVRWQLGQAEAEGRAFVVDGRKLLIRFEEARQAVVLMMTGGPEIIVMCRR